MIKFTLIINANEEREFLKEFYSPSTEQRLGKTVKSTLIEATLVVLCVLRITVFGCVPCGTSRTVPV